MLCMLHYKRKICQPKGALNMTTSSSKKILVMGGTRFIGIFLSRLLVEEGHQVKFNMINLASSHAIDPKSRHKGKLENEALLESKGVNYTSIGPVYIYGPLNYSPVE
ncbi:putative NAD(P)-binding domain superfamily [Helianthus anomalus]